METPFKILAQQGYARRGTLQLKHGVVQTPVFMPVGTYGAVKSMAPDEISEVGSQIILGNTYHLFTPGPEVIASSAASITGWAGRGRSSPTAEASRSFSLFRTEEDDRRRGDLPIATRWQQAPSHPGLGQIQRAIGSDIAMVLDECVALPATKEQLSKALELSYRWAKRFLECERLDGQKIFGIVQGGVDPELRKRSLELTASLPIDGLAIGSQTSADPTFR